MQKNNTVKCIGMIYEITGNSNFSAATSEYDDLLSESAYPTEIDDICSSIKDNGFSLEIIDGPMDLLNRHVELKSKCNYFFNKSIGFKGLERKVAVPAIGQLFNIPIIGSSAYSMTLARHKYHTNRLLLGLGLKVPFAYLIYSELSIPVVSIFPVIVKPNAESDSLGISEQSICFTQEEMISQIKEILAKFNQPVIIEQYIPGDELKVAVIGNGVFSKAMGCVTAQRNGKSLEGSLQTRHDVLNKAITYVSTTSESLSQKASSIASYIHQVFELRDYSRCDFRVGEDNELYCMEVSTHPYIAMHDSSFVIAGLQNYANYNAVIKAILDAGIARLEKTMF